MRITGELTIHGIVKLIRKHLPKGIAHNVILEDKRITIEVKQKENTTNEIKRYLDNLYNGGANEEKSEVKQRDKLTTKQPQSESKPTETTQKTQKKPKKLQIVTSLLERSEDIFYEENFTNVDLEENKSKFLRDGDYLVSKIRDSIYNAIIDDGIAVAKERQEAKPDYVRVEVYNQEEKRPTKMAEFEEELRLGLSDQTHTQDLLYIEKIIKESGIIQELEEKGII